MKIGIIGSGSVAQSLASGVLKHGHEVTLGRRDPAKLAEFAKANPNRSFKNGNLSTMFITGTSPPANARIFRPSPSPAA